MSAAIPFTIDETGRLQMIYDDSLPLRDLEAVMGAFTIQRASHVEPTPAGLWAADMAPSGGPVLGPFTTRAAALAAEVRWLQVNKLNAD